ncbi:PCNA-associated factor [Acyrthosiphon pisum]|uniref:PCNA-associated factor n=1 Tax=Acyrthosiphon pisum TaxID=7029 RepID=A0A8R1WAC6_ACYPI|nr:PCNA-associated factor [Acyrthosiphon pisum]|eukprot:XP_003248329.1 PREDICTED: PCNA-associated factor-like [Acyrthosiphon pisum]
MVRTKQSVSYKISIGKVPKIAACKAAIASSSSGSSSSSSPSTSKNKYSSGGGNSVHPREIPFWQKEITCFFQVKKDEELPQPSANDEDDDVVELPPPEMMQAGSSKM